MSKRRAKRYEIHASYYRSYVREQVDCDYSAKLSDEQLLWLKKFLREYYNNSFVKGDQIMSDEDKKKMGRTNYERQNCTYAKKKNEGALKFELPEKT